MEDYATRNATRKSIEDGTIFNPGANAPGYCYALLDPNLQLVDRCSKHACFITNSDGEVLFISFSASNDREGFESLFQRICSASDDLTKIKVGREATGHYRTYLTKKRAKGKHYNVALSHVAKKLVRLIYAMEKSGQTYTPTT